MASQRADACIIDYQLCVMTFLEYNGLTKDVLQIIDAFTVYALLTCATQVSEESVMQAMYDHENVLLPLISQCCRLSDAVSIRLLCWELPLQLLPLRLLLQSRLLRANG